MNFTVALKLLLILSIALQSLTTVASATSQIHLIDIEHLQTQHDHKSDLESLDGDSDEEGHEIKDCHHCGHCSGSHFSWVLVNNINSSTKLLTINNIPYQFEQTKEFLDATLRPPIS